MTTPRHRWSFSLRAMFVAVTTLSVAAGIMRVFPLYAPVAVFVGAVALLSIGVLVFLAMLLYVGYVALSDRFHHAFRRKDLPAAKAERP
jgi:hypothetical protein